MAFFTLHREITFLSNVALSLVNIFGRSEILCKKIFGIKWDHFRSCIFLCKVPAQGELFLFITEYSPWEHSIQILSSCLLWDQFPTNTTTWPHCHCQLRESRIFSRLCVEIQCGYKNPAKVFCSGGWLHAAAAAAVVWSRKSKLWIFCSYSRPGFVPSRDTHGITRQDACLFSTF